MIFEGDLVAPPFGKREPEVLGLDREFFDGPEPLTDEEEELYRGLEEYEEFQRSNSNGR